MSSFGGIESRVSATIQYFEDVWLFNLLSSHEDRSFRNASLFTRYIEESTDLTVTPKPDSVQHSLLPRATGPNDRSRRVHHIYPVGNQYVRPIDRFEGAMPRTKDLPTQILLPPPLPDIPRNLPPIESPVVGHIKFVSGRPEVGERGQDGAITSYEHPVRLNFLIGQGGMFFYGRMRAKPGMTGAPFLTGIRFNMYNAKPINDGIQQAISIGRVASIALIIPYVDENSREPSMEYAQELQARLQEVFPSARSVLGMVYPYESPDTEDPGIITWEFEAQRNGEIERRRHFIALENIPPPKTLKGLWSRLKTRYRRFRVRLGAPRSSGNLFGLGEEPR